MRGKFKLVLGAKHFAVFPTWIVTVGLGFTMENTAISMNRVVSIKKKFDNFFFFLCILLSFQEKLCSLLILSATVL